MAIETEILSDLVSKCTPGDWFVLKQLRPESKIQHYVQIAIGHKKKTGLPYVAVNASYDQPVDSILANATLISIAPALAKEVLYLRNKLSELSTE